MGVNIGVMWAWLGGRGLLLIAVGGEVRRRSLEWKSSQLDYSDVVASGRRVQSLAVDTEHRLVYWTDSADRAIRRATIPADDRRPAVVQTLRAGRLLTAPSGIAFDWVAKYTTFTLLS